MRKSLYNKLMEVIFFFLHIQEDLFIFIIKTYCLIILNY